MNGTFERCDSVPEAFAALAAARLGAGTTRLFLSGGSLAADCYRALATATTSEDAASAVDW
ncbi:MAG: hypothetical protein JO368_00520, partial [Acidimicrobiales bacterium]|nr:hypothetical protein [Acidimicrobiales bacterium]